MTENIIQKNKLDTITTNKITIPYYEDYKKQDFLKKQKQIENQIKIQIKDQESKQIIFLKDQLQKQNEIQINIEKYKTNDDKYQYTYQSFNQLNKYIKTGNQQKNILSKIISLIDFNQPDIHQLHIQQIQNQIDQLKLTYQLHISNFESEFIKLRTIMYKDIIELEQMMMASNAKNIR